jgi:photosynthetic reaction center H subunit
VEVNMETGAITGYIDVAQIVLYAFWIFFAGLVVYLRREDKREGYPLESDRSLRSGGRVRVQGFPAIPSPKTFLLPHGGVVLAPRDERDWREVLARPTEAWPGAPLEPTGNPMVDGVGPAAYANRAEVPDLTWDGRPKIVPLRVADDHVVESRDPDPRGMPVVGADGETGGIARDLWVDRSEPQFRYLEVEVQGADGPRRVLVPMLLVRVDGRRGRVAVDSVMGHHFAAAPGLANADQVTLREEDRICAYFGSGNLYAAPSRQEPLL